MPVAVFRADASPSVGGGHVMRCLTLANALADRSWRCAVACNAGGTQIVPALNASDHEVLELNNEEAVDPITLRRRWPEGIDLLVVDHYGLDRAYEASCRPWTRQVFVIDDLANRYHDADLLLDQTFGRMDSDYRSLVPKTCRLFLGTEYALLRPEFARARQQALRRRAGTKSIQRVLISMGSTDPENVTGQVLDVIGKSGLHLTVDVILGAAAPHRDAVTEQMRYFPEPSVLHFDPPVAHIVEMMIAADLGIGAGGISAWERCCLGLPSMVLMLADNQRDNVRALADVGGACQVATEGARGNGVGIRSALETIWHDASRLAGMSAAATRVCDGRGVERIVIEILRTSACAQ